jgi:hypothetical protein
MASTPHASGVRNRLRHKESLSLPEINAADFADVQRSFDDCGRDETPKRSDSSDMGIDLPPVPSSYIGQNLSRVTEKDEGNESTLMRDTLSDMGRAILALSSSPASAPAANTTGVSSRMDLSDLAPIFYQQLAQIRRRAHGGGNGGGHGDGHANSSRICHLATCLVVCAFAWGTGLASQPTHDQEQSKSRRHPARSVSLLHRVDNARWRPTDAGPIH